MKTSLKAMLIVVAIAGLYAPATAVAQKSAGGVVGEARLHPGTWNNQRSSRSGMRSRPMYRSNAPAIVRSETVPRDVAQAPTERRSFSYEPTESAGSAEQPRKNGGCGCGNSVRAEREPMTALPSTRSERSFSYEPSADSNNAEPAVRSYSAPRMRSSQPSRSSERPRYLLPKTDPRKYRN